MSISAKSIAGLALLIAVGFLLEAGAEHRSRQHDFGPGVAGERWNWSGGRIELRDEERTVQVERLSSPRRQAIVARPVSLMVLFALARVL
jgi:hypothetical protein